MGDKITLTLPPLPPGADSWHLSVPVYIWDTPTDTRRWYERAAYSILMYTHDRVERLWDWCWKQSHRFAPPKSVIVGEKHVPVQACELSKEELVDLRK